MQRQSNGIAKRQNKERNMANVIWEIATTTVKVLSKTMQRQSNGIAKPLNKGIAVPNIIWDGVINMVME